MSRNRGAVPALGIVLFAVACGNSNSSTGGPPPGQTGNACATAAQCYPGLDAATVQGTVTCLSVQNGYCTHTCGGDANCCSVPGECVSGFTEVCSPFQSTGQTYCLLSCSASAIASAPNGGVTDPGAYCQRFADPSFTCRSSGGGSNNQKFCGP